MSEQNELAELTRNWTAPAELSGSGPRETRLSGLGMAAAGLAVALFVGAMGAGYGLARLASRQAAERDALRGNSMETQAVITRHWRTGGKDDTRKISYRFEYQGEIFHGTSSAPRGIWGTLAVGSPIAVRFVPANPRLNHPSEWESNVMPGWLPGAIGALLVGIAMLLMFAIRRQTRLLSEGRAAPGRVTGYRRVQHGQTLTYEFPLLNGGTGKGRGGQTRRPPPIGTVITVIYDRDNPKRNAPYPLELVRLDR